MVKRLGAPASLVAGIVWLAVWWHQRLAHGTTELNEMNAVVGLTWMDTGKILILALAFVFVGLASVASRQGRSGRLGAAGRLGSPWASAV